MRKSAFNLVEILVAMAILTIGMVGLVGIIPVSTEAMANANGKLYAAEIGQFMSDYADADCIGLTAGGNTSGARSLSKLKEFPTAYPTATPVKSTSIVAFTATGQGSMTLYKTGTPGIFVVEHSTQLTSGSIVDYSAYVNMWYNDTIKSLGIDVSWPAKTADTPVNNRAAGRSITLFRRIRGV
jgi:prepilin-type N-terminal cleavage/methylation domain-containing protein